jgi:flagellar biosynthesis protein FlhF
MNIRRFAARTSREALTLVRQALGVDAVVLSTKPCIDGVEVLAMAHDSMLQIERMNDSEPETEPAAQPPRKAERAQARPRQEAAPPAPVGVEDDVAQLQMSTLSFQDYVRERMLRRRQAALADQAGQAAAPAAADTSQPARRAAQPPARAVPVPRETPAMRDERVQAAATRRAPAEEAQAASCRPGLAQEAAPRGTNAPKLAAEPGWPESPSLFDGGPAASRRDQQDVMSELRSMKGLIEDRFGALAFMEKLQRQPAHARLTQRLLDGGFSPALIRKLSEGLPSDVDDEAAWAAGVLERNLLCGDADSALEDQGGVFALIGSTGVGKTTSTAKIAAAFATRHGAAQLGLVTLDAYRVAAHEQLRSYGRILGVPVHTAHDRSSLEDLLDLLSGKKMVLIDTAGMAQRDARTRELLDMLGHRSIKRLLVINAAAHGETIEDVMLSYRAATCEGVVLSKVDEAVKLGPALDALIRHKLKVVGVANGQRVPEDWHRLSSHALVHRALRAMTGKAYRLDASEVSLVFAAMPHPTTHATPAGPVAA